VVDNLVDNWWITFDSSSIGLIGRDIEGVMFQKHDPERVFKFLF